MSSKASRLAVPVVLAALIAGSVPGQVPSRVLDTVGLSQPWGVFAPRPPTQRMVLSADVEFAGGGHATWRPPRRPAILAPLDYHWESWEALVVRDQASTVWPRAARWVALHGGWGARRVVRVTLRRSWTDVPPPGGHALPAIQNEFDFYTLAFGPGGIR